MRRIGAFALLSLLFSLCSAIPYAQNATTSLRGVVKDPSGAVVPGATITLLNKAAGQTLNVTTKNTGEYQLVAIPPAKYVITITAAGFGTQTKLAELLVDQPATINFELSIKSNDTVVDVTESAQTLNTTDASLGGSADNAEIQALPSETRNVPDLLSLQPGVLAFPPPSNPALADSRSGAVNGGRSDQGNITLDGVDDNDQVRGLAFFGVLRETQDSVEEFRVTTGNANADQGRSSGAQVSLVTKSGTNKYHGAAYEYFRPTDTVSNDFFNKNSQLGSGLNNRPPKLIRNTFGGDFGGAIVKNKLFFFANYEGQRQAESAIVSQQVPTASYKEGIINYTGDIPGTGDPATNTPPSTETQTITADQLATLDAGCTVCGTSAYTPGPGPNPNALAYFATLPTANTNNPGGSGDGLNVALFTFASPNPKTLNTSIVRIDYIPSTKQRIFVRGNLQKDTTGGTEQFPGQGPSSQLVDNTKGMTFGDTWTISSNLVNDIRYGYIRQGYGQSGVGSGDYVDFRYIATQTAETRSTISIVPVNNIVDNFNWTKGKHSLQFGVNWRLIHQNRSSDANSYNSASTNPQWLDSTEPLDPSTLGTGLDMVDGGFTESYKIAFANIVGTVPSVTNQYNYQVTSPTGGTLLADGAPISRHFSANEYEGYAQDQWRATSALTITFGLRYTVLQTPWETKGQEVTPTTNTDAFYKQRETSAQQGIIYEPDLSFAPAGKYYNKPGFYAKSKNNFAPRFALAYAANAKTSLRFGAGMYYDHFGEALINVFDQNGEFGLSSSKTNPANTYSIESAPRFTGRRNFPFSNGVGAPNTTFPYTYPEGTEQISWGIDNKLKTPYTEAFDLSVQRELPGGLTLETAYVGRLGRHLLSQLDLAEPTDFVDTQGGGDYYSAGTQLSKLANATGDNQFATAQTIPYFEDIFPFMANNSAANLYDNNGNLIYSGLGKSATQNIYTDEWAPNMEGLGATTSLSDIDYTCNYGCPVGYVSKFWQPQFDSLFSLSTIGMSYYNALEITLKHANSHGFQGEVSYTFSKSIDFSSDAERSTFFSSGVATSGAIIQNTWRPALNRGVSDFDTRHLVTADYVYALPVGRGKAIANTSHRVVDEIVGGWQLSGIFRYSSALPFSLGEPGYTTNWTFGGYGVITDPSQVKVKKHIDGSGNPVYFANANTISAGAYNGSPVRVPYPGEAGERNNLRGDGYINLDSGLAKSWKVADLGALKFTWEVYNVTNTNRFDPESIASTLTYTVGTASSLLTQSRRMQFSLRYDF
jgi:hypothetical protein